MSKQINLLDLDLSSTICEEDRRDWKEAVIHAIEGVNNDKEYLYLAEIDVDNACSFSTVAKELSSIFSSKGVDNIVFVPKNRITLSKIEIIHS